MSYYIVGLTLHWSLIHHHWRDKFIAHTQSSYSSLQRIGRGDKMHPPATHPDRKWEDEQIMKGIKGNKDKKKEREENRRESKLIEKKRKEKVLKKENVQS